MTTFNLNHRCRVRVTERGRVIWRQYHEELNLKPPSLPEDGTLETELWRVMQVFGSSLYNGCHVPIETEVEWIP